MRRLTHPTRRSLLSISMVALQVLASGSHGWVREQIAAAGPGGLSHDELNQKCINHFLRLARSNKVWIPLDHTAPFVDRAGATAVAAAAPELPPVPAPKVRGGGPGPKWELAGPEDGDGYVGERISTRNIQHSWLHLTSFPERHCL